MEQKKILWIVLAVSVFVLIIFGTAILLYSPSRGAEATLQQASAVVPAQNTARQGTTIDPDSWVRDPGTTPGLDSPVDPAGSGVNLTIVNRNESVTNYGALDVTGLTRNQESHRLEAPFSRKHTRTNGETGRYQTGGNRENAAAEKPVQTTRVATAAAPVKNATGARKETGQKDGPGYRLLDSSRFVLQ